MKQQRLKVAIVSLGCDKNLVDSEIMLGILDKDKFKIVSDLEDSDIIIINTCGFIADSKEESINAILDIAEYKKTAHLKSLLVTGCLSQRYKEELITEIPEIDGLIGTNEYDVINEIINKSLKGEKPILINNSLFSYEEVFPRVRLTPSHYRYIKIAEGCNNFCTFCVIPSIRGSYRSRSIESIIIEVKSFVEQGSKEIILIAQDTSCYGEDIYGKLMLPELINQLSKIDSLDWIRVHYLYPGNISEELINTFATNNKLCKYIDMPLQHSEEKILKSMLRPQFKKDIKKLIAKIRSKVPNVAFRTSLIVGFPGETEEDFINLVKFVKEIEFDRLGVFTYSDEDGTSASNLPNKVSDEIQEKRAQILMNVQNEIAKMKNSNFIGKEVEVLIDSYDELSNTFIGRTKYDAPDVDGEVYINNIEANVGDICTVKITHSYDYDLVGEGIKK